VARLKQGRLLGCWRTSARYPWAGRLSVPVLAMGACNAAGTGADVFSDPSVWSVTCFVVKVGARRQGVATALLRGAIGLARQGGATVVEAYPVDLGRKPSASAAELYHGTMSTFLRAGFAEVARPAPARPVVRLSLAGPRPRPAAASAASQQEAGKDR
jgi:GNAT superfamily N-acetyltransferase